MNIDCEIELKDLSGAVLKDSEGVFTLGKALGNIIVDAKEGGKMKLYILATKLFQAKGKVEVDESDLSLIKKVVASSETYKAIVIGQIEQILAGLKKEDDKK